MLTVLFLSVIHWLWWGIKGSTYRLSDQWKTKNFKMLTVHTEWVSKMCYTVPACLSRTSDAWFLLLKKWLRVLAMNSNCLIFSNSVNIGGQPLSPTLKDHRLSRLSFRSLLSLYGFHLTLLMSCSCCLFLFMLMGPCHSPSTAKVSDISERLATGPQAWWKFEYIKSK